jgi:hypothetical protein
MARLKQINIKRRKKTKYMVIGTRKRLSRFSQDITVSINGEVIKQVNSKKTFGVIID